MDPLLTIHRVAAYLNVDPTNALVRCRVESDEIGLSVDTIASRCGALLRRLSMPAHPELNPGALTPPVLQR